MNIITLDSKAVWYTIKHFSIFYDAGVVPWVFCCCWVNFQLTSPIKRGLVYPICLFPLEEPSRLWGRFARVTATENDLWPPTFIDFSSDGCNLGDVSHRRGFANNLGTSSFPFLGYSCHPKLMLCSYFQLTDFEPVRTRRSLVFGVAFLSPVFHFSENEIRLMNFCQLNPCF